MAPHEDNIPSTGSASAAPTESPAPIKKVAAKRAPRKATKKASTPKQTPEAAPGAASETASDAAADPSAFADMTAGPARKAAKRAPRKTAKKSASAPLDLAAGQADSSHADPAQADPAKADPAKADRAKADPAQADPAPAGSLSVHAPVDRVPEPEPVKAPAVQTFGLLFQAPAPTEAPRRRRATAPAAAPAPEQAATHSRETSRPARAEQGDDGRQDGAQQDGAQQDGVQQDGVQQDGGRQDGGRQDGARLSDELDESGPDGAPRRRRRGGKGRRGRAGGEGGGDEPSTSADQDSTEPPSAAVPTSDEDSESEEGGESHRRTRRRRRSGGDAEDQQGTTTRVREPRPKRDEVTSVRGSTRLEAKKLRRREGREAGRRRTVITEAEFLARRESVERVMVVRHKQDRTQIGVLEDGVLVEHYVSRETNASMAGNVYLGRIQNVLPSMEAAFVDIGKGRNAVLYAGEVNWDAAGLDNRAKRIENALSSGQSVLVQVTKDPIGHKGARLTSQVSLPGRYLVYVPDGNMMGISRKLPDTERTRLKKILREVVPENAGVIVRTAAEGASEEELRADVTRLTAAWNDIQAKAKAKSTNAPVLLHGEPDLTVRVIRDVFNEDFARLVVSGEPAWEAVSGYVDSVAPDLADRIQKWTGDQDLFTHYRVDEQIAKAMDRKVWLPSGGTLVIDRTEAMTVVDVNTGKFVGSGGNLEETVTRNNIEAAEEVVRQLRLRDIGGIIVIDFIDMVLESNRDLVVRRLLECLGRDRTKHQVAEVTSLGLVQMTRKRVGAGLIEVFSEDCEHCNGRGIIVSADPIDRPAAGDGSSSGGSTGGGDSGSGRGTRGRRGRGTGRDTSVVAAPEPTVPAGGPTPAQIAAAAHAAAIAARPQTEVAEQPGDVGQISPAGPSGEPEELSEHKRDQPQEAPAQVAAPRKSRRRSSRSAASPASSVDAATVLVSDAPRVVEPADVPSDEPLTPQTASAEVAAPRRSRRRSSRSATSPAFSVDPGASTMTEQPVVVDSVAPQRSVELPAVGPEPTSTAQGDQTARVAEVKEPVVRARRKRPRVVAPAGPPRGADQSEGASGEFGS